MAALRADCRSCGKSGQPSYAAWSACHKRPTLSRCFQPSDAPAGHIGGLICEDLHDVDLERDIGNQWFGAMVARLQRRSSNAPLFRTGLVDLSSFGRSLLDAVLLLLSKCRLIEV